MKIYNTELSTRVRATFEHPDTGVDIQDYAVVCNWDEITDKNFHLNLAKQIWDKDNYGRYFHYMILEISYVLECENQVITTNYRYSGGDELEQLPTVVKVMI